MMRSRIIKTCLLLSLVLVAVFSQQDQVDDCIPQEFHISLGEYYSTPIKTIIPDDTSVVHNTNVLYIVYRTRTECPNTAVQFTKLDSTNVTLPPAYLTNFKASPYPYNATFHVVQVDRDLVELGKFYTYQGMLNGSVVGNPIVCFIPLRDTASTPTPMSHIIFGDFDISNSSRTSLAAVAKELINRRNEQLPTSLIITGDIAYHLEDNNGIYGDEFMKAMEPMFSAWPTMNVPGNHENKYNYANYVARFRMPYYNQTSNHFFSFNMGFIHFVGINTDKIVLEQNYSKILETYLTNDLKYADSEEQRSIRPWIIVYTHRPFFTSSTEEELVGEYYKSLFKNIETILYTYNVDLFITGHIHAYQRTSPVYQNISMGWNSGTPNSMVNAKSTLQVVEGAMGTRTGRSNLEAYLKRNYNVYINNNTGYGILTSPIDKMTLLYQHKLADGSIVDAFSLSKTTLRPFHLKPEEAPQPTSPWLIALILVIVSACCIVAIKYARDRSMQKPPTDAEKNLQGLEMTQRSEAKDLQDLNNSIQVVEPAKIPNI